MTLTNKIIVAIGVMLLAAASSWAAYSAQPALLLVPLGLLLALCFLQYPHGLFYALLVSIPWSGEYNFSATLATDLPDEPLMLLMAFTSVAMLITAKKGGVSQHNIHPLLLLLLLQIVWLAGTVTLSTYPLLSLKYFLAKSWYLLAFVAAPLLLYKDEKWLKRSALLVFGSMLVVTCVVLLRQAQRGFSFAKINEALSPFFRNHVTYAALLVMQFPLAIAFLQLSKKEGLKWLVRISILLLLAALLLSYSRGAWLALLTGLAAYALIKKGWLFKSFLVIFFLVAGAVFWLQYHNRYLQFAPDHNTTIFHTNFGEHLEATYKGKDVSTAERFYRWIAGARMSADGRVTGFGPATFYSNYKTYTIPLYRTWVSDNKEHSTVHNYFLLLLVEQGATGLLLFLVLIGSLFWYAQKIYNRTTQPFRRATVAAVGALVMMQCTVNFLSDLIETDKVGSIFYLCVAVLVIADRRTRTEDTN